MNISFTKKGWEDFSYWIEQDINIAVKIKELLNDVRKNPFYGIGKPEPLKFNLKGLWSRRITSEHRLVYQIKGTKGIDQRCIVLQCRYHYDD